MIVKQNRFFAFSGKFSKDDRIGAFFPPLFNLFGTEFFKCFSKKALVSSTFSFLTAMHAKRK